MSMEYVDRIMLIDVAIGKPVLSISDIEWVLDPLDGKAYIWGIV